MKVQRATSAPLFQVCNPHVQAKHRFRTDIGNTISEVVKRQIHNPARHEAVGIGLSCMRLEIQIENRASIHGLFSHGSHYVEQKHRLLSNPPWLLRLVISTPKKQDCFAFKQLDVLTYRTTSIEEG